MKQNKDLSIINCLAASFTAFFFTVPFHEFLHLLTHVIYGDKLLCYSAGAVDAVSPDYSTMSVFDTIMDAGGSASIINAILGIILLIVLLKVSMSPLMRVFLTMLMGGQFVQGIGYLMIGGFFAAGDWGAVFKQLADHPGLITGLRITLSLIGSLGIMALFFILNYMSYYFIEDKNDKSEKLYVAFRLHLIMFIVGIVIGIAGTMTSPFVKTGELSFGLALLYNMMWIPFFWGFMFTGVMNVLPPKESRFLYKLPQKPNWLFFAFGLILVLIDIFIFGPGIFFN